MEIVITRGGYSATVPPTRCKSDVALQIAEIAQSEGVSKSDVIRSALDFFLSAYVTQNNVKSINAKTGTTKKVVNVQQ